MEWLRNVRPRSGRNSTLDPDLPSIFTNILSHIEESRPLIRSHRKFLENSLNQIHGNTHSGDQSRGNDSPLNSMITLSDKLLSYQREFSGKNVKDLISELKKWEDRCDQLLKLKSDLLKSQIELAKLKDKQSQSKEKEKENLKTIIAASESTHASSKETLCTELFRYHILENDFLNKILTFLNDQITFLQNCLDEAKSSFDSINPSPYTRAKTYFGTSLREHLNDEGYSVVLKKCIGYLMAKEGYCQEGIFRIPGQLTHINLLRQALDQERAEYEFLELCGVYVVADVLKQYLRELREPLVTLHFVSNWPSENPHSKQISSLMHDYLPVENRKNLHLLLLFLSKVLANEKTSKMTIENLAITIGSSLCYSGDLELVAVIAQRLFKYSSKILEDEKEITAIFQPPNLAKQPVSPPMTLNTAHKSGIPPEVPSRTYQSSTRTSGEEIGPKTKAPLPPCMPYSPQASVSEKADSSATHRPPPITNTYYSNPITVPCYQHQTSQPNVQVTYFRNSVCSSIPTHADRSDVYVSMPNSSLGDSQALTDTNKVREGQEKIEGELGKEGDINSGSFKPTSSDDTTDTKNSYADLPPVTEDKEKQPKGGVETNKERADNATPLSSLPKSLNEGKEKVSLGENAQLRHHSSRDSSVKPSSSQPMVEPSPKGEAMNKNRCSSLGCYRPDEGNQTPSESKTGSKRSSLEDNPSKKTSRTGNYETHREKF